MFLSETAKKVYVLVRSEGLAASMSQYLIRRIETTPNIELRSRCEIVELQGDSYLESVRWCNRDADEVTAAAGETSVHLHRCRSFLPAAVATDAKGFVCTGAEVSSHAAEPPWILDRPPFPLETNCPGVFAAGDVRASSTKRVASAVGEGSVVVQYVHQLLAASLR